MTLAARVSIGARAVIVLGVLAVARVGTEGGSGSAQAPEHPDPRAHHQLAYHAADRRVYLIGGSTRRDNGYFYFDDVWSWNGERWTSAGSLPFRRSSHRVVYHARRRSLVLFGGGFDRTFAADGRFWEWRDGTWAPLGDDAQGAGRAEPGMCYDERRDRVVVFGGWDDANVFSDSTWEWSGSALRPALLAGGPSARAGHAFLYDPVRRRCLLFGGRDDAGLLSDTWEWDGAEWRQIAVSGPSARWFLGAATDPVNRRIVVFGGSGDERDFGDTWVWNGHRWLLLDGDGPAARGMAKLAFDGTGVTLFGGRTRTPGGFEDRNDTWILRDREWVRVR